MSAVASSSKSSRTASKRTIFSTCITLFDGAKRLSCAELPSYLRADKATNARAIHVRDAAEVDDEVLHAFGLEAFHVLRKACDESPGLSGPVRSTMAAFDVGAWLWSRRHSVGPAVLFFSAGPAPLSLNQDTG